MWMTGNSTFDFLLCQVWHGQAIYWSGVTISVWNLVLMAVERFLIIRYPYKHRDMPPSKVYKAWAILYVLIILFLVPAYFQVKYESGKCVPKFYFDTPGANTFNAFYGIFWLFLCYVIPTSLFVFLYTKIIIHIRQRQKSNIERHSVLDNMEGQQSRIYTRANQQLTKTAIIVTIVFIISLSYDCWYCLLGYTGITEYVFNSPLQKVGVFLSTFNSCANPFIYATGMSVFRKSLRKTFQCGSLKFDGEYGNEAGTYIIYKCSRDGASNKNEVNSARSHSGAKN